ncbi:MAG: hypothetical protein AAGH40_09750 [Verrucomicrobiota bacterium]
MNGKEWLPPPPPKRAPKRRLSLECAVAVAIRAESKGIVKPMADPLSNLPELDSCKAQDNVARLLELQADIIVREDALQQKEIALKNRERELSEHGALLEAHEKVLTSRMQSGTSEEISAEDASNESEALQALRNELNSQERSVAEARRMLKEREAFIEQCENELVEKSMLLTEREARIEQKEEDYKLKTKNPFDVEALPENEEAERASA